MRSAKQKAERISCSGRLKQIGTAYRLWAGDFGSTNKFQLYPARVPTNTGGALEWVVQGQVWPVYQLMSNELNTPLILVCPADTRRVAANFGVLRNTNLSYFVGLDADESQPEGLLAGDRNLAVRGQPLLPGVVTLTTNQAVNWTRTHHGLGGNVGLTDGSVQQIKNEHLRAYLVGQGLATNRLAIP